MTLFGKRTFAFENYGGSFQLRLGCAEDLAALEKLDEPFWMATSGPADQFTCDPALLKRLDRDGSGRVQSWEVREAVRWLLHVLRDRQGVTERSDVLDLKGLDTSHTEGTRLYETGKRILENLGQGDGAALSLVKLRDRKTIFSQGSQNGDGVIPPGGVDESDLRRFVEDIIATVGSVPDLNGSPGVNQELLENFLANAEALLAWQRDSTDALLPLGVDTAERYGRYKNLAAPIERYFERCRVVALNEILGRAAEEAACAPELFQTESEAAAYLAGAPLSRPRADGVLPLKNQVNPFYSQPLADFSETVLAPILGESFEGIELSEGQWETVKQAFAPYERWLAAKSGGQVETLGLDTLQTYAGSELPRRLRALIEADLAAGQELEALEDLEYLILLQRWIMDLCNNFVSFPYLYNPDQRAMVETGRLVMEGRNFNLNLRVADVNAHSATAARSGIYLLYSEVTGATANDTFYIVTPVTSGPLGVLGVGKRGVLFDPAGREWDTRVVQVVENPVSLREAVAAPFKRIAALVSSTAERFTSGAEQQLQARISKATTTLQTGVQEDIAAPAATAPAAAAQAPSTSSAAPVRDLLLAGGVAVAALGSSFAFIAAKFSQMEFWHVGVALAVGLTIVVVPTMALASMKLRRQNLSAILEASGWAINAPMRLTRSLRHLIVQQPAHPKSFRRVRRDLTRVFARTIRIKGRTENQHGNIHVPRRRR